MKPVLSIIIPTKNRKEYCLAAIQQILALKDERIELVIQDNSDIPILNESDSLLQESRLQYHHNNKILSFVDNFNEAVSLASGEYLCMIGDDDGILPNILAIAAYAKANHIDAVIPALNSVFVWPMEKSFIKNGDNGYLCISYLSSSKTNVNPKKGLSDLLASGGQFYQTYDLPRLYHGIVCKKTVDKVKMHTGHYFGGLTPDIYMSVALALECETVIKIGFPVTVSGICTGSGSSNSATGKHTGELKEAPHFIGHENYIWNDRVPAIYTVETIWADTVLHALEDYKYNLTDQFNIGALIAICKHKYPQFKTTLTAYFKSHKISKLNMQCAKLKYIRAPFIIRCFKRLARKKNTVTKLYGVPNISQAVSKTIKQMDLHKIAYESKDWK